MKRFWDKVNKTKGCWLWTASIDTKGYGQFGLAEGVLRRAHRIAYEFVKGPIPKGLVLDHLCRVRHCVNPDHLQPVTFRENLMRGIGPAANNNRKSFCKKGHPFNTENTYRSTQGRSCRECAKEYQQKLRDKNKIGRIDRRTILKTHCIRGHEMAGKDLRINKNGTRACRACERARERENRAQRPSPV